MQPHRPDFIVFGAPLLLDEDIQEVVDTLRSGWIGTGPKVTRFEAAFQQYTGAPFCVAVNSCTAALELALEIAGVGAGDEVITTPLTFPATANVVVHRGARPVFADVDPVTANLDPAEITRHITERTRAVLPVHLAGRPCDMQAIRSIAQAHRLVVIEDAAHALEARYGGQNAGTLGDFGAFSFYPTKSLTTSEGGVLVTQREAWAEKARIMRLHGISADAWSRYSESGFTHYETLYAGYKCNMTDLQAALGLHQFERLDQNLERRRGLWKIFNAGFSGLPGITTPTEPKEPDCVHARHLYTIYIDPSQAGISRDALMVRLKEMSVGTGVHYTAVHLHRFYRETYGYQAGDFPRAEWIADRTLSLPLTARMDPADAEYVVDAVRYALEHP